MFLKIEKNPSPDEMIRIYGAIEYAQKKPKDSLWFAYQLGRAYVGPFLFTTLSEISNPRDCETIQVQEFGQTTANILIQKLKAKGR